MRIQLKKHNIVHIVDLKINTIMNVKTDTHININIMLVFTIIWMWICNTDINIDNNKNAKSMFIQTQKY